MDFLSKNLGLCLCISISIIGFEVLLLIYHVISCISQYFAEHETGAEGFGTGSSLNSYFQLDHILLETTGLTNPAPLASGLSLDDQLESAVKLDSIFKDDIKNVDRIAKLASDQQHVVHIRAAPVEERGEKHVKHNVLSLCDVSNENN